MIVYSKRVVHNGQDEQRDYKLCRVRCSGQADLGVKAISNKVSISISISIKTVSITYSISHGRYSMCMRKGVLSF